MEIREAILGKNDRLAERNRGFFRARGLLVLNVLSSPGSGKTTFLRETIRHCPKLKAGVIVGDLATDNDAQRLRESGAPVVQVTTGTVCHLEAEMVARAVQKLDLAGLDLLLIETSATSSARLRTIWAKTCASSCCRSPRAKINR